MITATEYVDALFDIGQSFYDSATTPEVDPTLDVPIPLMSTPATGNWKKEKQSMGPSGKKVKKKSKKRGGSGFGDPAPPEEKTSGWWF